MTRNPYGAGSVRQRGSGWQIRWSEGFDPFTGDHIRRSETIYVKTKTEARRILQARIAARGSGSRVTLGELVDATLPLLPITDNTRETYGYALAHLPELARAWPASDITIIDAKTLIQGLTDRHGAPTVRKAHSALMACWRQATLNGWVVNNPWRGQRLPKVSTSAGLVLTDAEVAAVVEAASDDLDATWVRVHLATGARPGEVVGLRWSAIADDSMTFVDAKHDGELRPVAVDAGTMAITRRWQTKQRERALAAGVTIDADPWLLSSDPASSVPWRREYAGGFRWRQLRGRAGVRPELRLYDLRHTHNSWLAGADIDAATRGRRIGNSPAVNLAVYSHATRDREAADVAAKRLG